MDVTPLRLLIAGIAIEALMFFGLIAWAFFWEYRRLRKLKGESQ